MPIRVLMPALSPTMTEGHVASWLKSEGDTVSPGDVLAEIETDKATMEVEAIDGGVLARILVPGGTENVPVGTLIALLLEEGEDPQSLDASCASSSNSQLPVQPSALETQETPTFEAQSVSTPLEQGQRVIASPLARRMAQLHQLDLASIQGTGPKGRVIKADIEQRLSFAAKPPIPVSGAAVTPFETPYEEVKLSTMRKVIAKRLAEAKNTVPHFYLTIDCLVDALFATRSEVNQGLPQDQKLSVNDFILKACAKALHVVPDVNVSFTDQGVMRHYQRVDLAVAVAIEGGLVTPVVRDAASMHLLELSACVKNLVQKARAGKLMPEEYQGGTFSVSNLGMYGITQFAAIVNPPQAGILALGAAQKRPVVLGDTLTLGTQMTCTLSVDHRAVDGALGATFLQAFKKYIETPLLMLV